MKRILVDSDVLVDVLRGSKETAKKLEKLFEESELYISGITEMEILAGKDVENGHKRKLVVHLLSKFKKINPTNEIFKVASEFRRKYRISTPDCIIAATAYTIDATIFTRNVKDFSKIKESRILAEE